MKSLIHWKSLWLVGTFLIGGSLAVRVLDAGIITTGGWVCTEQSGQPVYSTCKRDQTTSECDPVSAAGTIDCGDEANELHGAICANTNTVISCNQEQFVPSTQTISVYSSYCGVTSANDCECNSWVSGTTEVETTACPQ